MLKQLYEQKYALLKTTPDFTVIASASRLSAVQQNCRRLRLFVKDTLVFEDLSSEEILDYLQGGPTLFSISGQHTLLPYIAQLKTSAAIVSEFLCWNYTSSFTPLDFYPVKNWRESLEHFSDSPTLTLLKDGFADDLYNLRQLVHDSTTAELLAFETVLATCFRPKLEDRSELFYYTSRIQALPGETVIDCGACASSYGGQFTTRFAKDVGPTGRVFAFEPILPVYRALEDDTEAFFNIITHNSAVWDRHTTLNFISDGITSCQIHSAEITTELLDSPKVEIVRAVPIDAILDGRPVHYLKMDVEGSELKALQGAAESIRKFKPKLSICLYHHPDDLLSIPSYIHSLCPEYRITLECNEGHVWSGLKLFAEVV
jgi:FkbM family methyltransferase